MTDAAEFSLENSQHGLGGKVLTVGGLILSLLPSGSLGLADIVKIIIASDNADDKDDEDVQASTLHESELSHFRWRQLRAFARMKKFYPANFAAADRHLNEARVKGLPAPAADVARNECWATPPASPFDAFAVAAALLTRSGAYHHVEPSCDQLGGDAEGPVPKRRLIVNQKQRERMTKCGRFWRRNPYFAYSPTVSRKDIKMVGRIMKEWLTIIKAWNEPLFDFLPQDQEPPGWWRAALSILIVADEASREVGFSTSSHTEHEDVRSHNYRRFWRNVAFSILGGDSARGGFTISTTNADIVCIQPKSRTAQIGCTLRSLSHNLASLPPRGLVRTSWICMKGYRDWRDPSIIEQHKFDHPQPPRKKCDPFNLLIVPYPFEISALDFRPARKARVARAGWSSFDAHPSPHGEPARRKQLMTFVDSLLLSARRDIGGIHGVVFPELALSAHAYRDLDERIFRLSGDLEFFCAGLYERLVLAHESRERRMQSCEYGNFAAMSVYYADPVRNVKMPAETIHRKHHRWRLDGRQIADYALGSSLDPSRLWWENINTVNRVVPIFAMRRGWTLTSLICEDLARIDPAQEVVRGIGPNLVIALLMDGAQITSRWPARYATVLADDPGSSVLTLTSMGLINRTNGSGRHKESRAIGLWQGGALSPTQCLELPDGAHALCLTLTIAETEEFTLDGRPDDYNAYVINLAAVRPVYVPAHVAPPPWGA